MLLAAIAALSLLLVVTGHPPKNCTFRYLHLGKGAYYAQCVPNPKQSSAHPAPAKLPSSLILAVSIVATFSIALFVFVRIADIRSRAADHLRRGNRSEHS